MRLPRQGAEGTHYRSSQGNRDIAPKTSDFQTCLNPCLMAGTHKGIAIHQQTVTVYEIALPFPRHLVTLLIVHVNYSDPV
ncbi:MAG: hypothetical protein F6K42_13955 [Leptolyngbya sp. SIO1D8]|nr:hypothetical protein [Leptolyngbya sp. SIO1D8]